MILIPEKEIEKKFEQLPEKLKEVLNSTAIFSLVDTICQSNYLKKEWVEDVRMITAEVILGFLDSDNFARELQEITGLNYQHASSVAKDIDKRIFAGLKEEIEKIYSPLPLSEEEIEDKKEAEEALLVTEKSEIKISPYPVDLRPKEEIKIPTPVPLPKKQETPAEGPAILFKSETITSATPITTERRRPTLGGLFGFSRRKETTPKEKIIAEIETPSQKPTIKPTIAKTEIPAFKVVHYSQFEPQKSANQTNDGPKMFVGQSSITPTPPPSFKPKIISVTPIPTEKSKMFVEQKPTAPTSPQPFKPRVISVTPIPPSPRIYLERKEITPTQINPTSLPIVPKAPVTPPKPFIPTIIPVELPKPPQQLPPAVPTPKSLEPTIATTVKEEEMVDLINLQKVKIKTEVEKVKDDTIIDLRK